MIVVASTFSNNATTFAQ